MNKNEKNTPDAPKNENGLIQMIRMGQSIHQLWGKHISGGNVVIIEPRHEKTNNLHMRKQRRRSASR